MRLKMISALPKFYQAVRQIKVAVFVLLVTITAPAWSQQDRSKAPTQSDLAALGFGTIYVAM